jgi:predicted transcriptional regulator of viral defense system
MTNLQAQFLKMLDEYGYDIFNLEMVRETGSFSNAQISQALRSLTNSGIINKLERGKFVKDGFSDEFVIGNFLAPDGGIAYWSALNAHGLTEQFPNVVYVQTSRRTGEFTHQNLRYKFIKVNASKVTGYVKNGYGNHIYQITDVEKTIVDCFDLPHHAGWYPEIIKAFNRAKINAKKMVKYCKAIDNLSVTKRLGYLSELLNKTGMEFFIDYAQSVLGNEYSLFEIDGKSNGNYHSHWKLIINMPEKEILEMANS